MDCGCLSTKWEFNIVQPSKIGSYPIENLKNIHKNMRFCIKNGVTIKKHQKNMGGSRNASNPDQ
jgi:hypothetical protein